MDTTPIKTCEDDTLADERAGGEADAFTDPSAKREQPCSYMERYVNFDCHNNVWKVKVPCPGNAKIKVHKNFSVKRFGYDSSYLMAVAHRDMILRSQHVNAKTTSGNDDSRREDFVSRGNDEEVKSSEIPPFRLAKRSRRKRKSFLSDATGGHYNSSTGETKQEIVQRDEFRWKDPAYDGDAQNSNFVATQNSDMNELRPATSGYAGIEKYTSNGGSSLPNNQRIEGKEISKKSKTESDSPDNFFFNAYDESGDLSDDLELKEGSASSVYLRDAVNGSGYGDRVDWSHPDGKVSGVHSQSPTSVGKSMKTMQSGGGGSAKHTRENYKVIPLNGRNRQSPDRYSQKRQQSPHGSDSPYLSNIEKYNKIKAMKAGGRGGMGNPNGSKYKNNMKDTAANRNGKGLEATYYSSDGSNRGLAYMKGKGRMMPQYSVEGNKDGGSRPFGDLLNTEGSEMNGDAEEDLPHSFFFGHPSVLDNPATATDEAMLKEALIFFFSDLLVGCLPNLRCTDRLRRRYDLALKAILRSFLSSDFNDALQAGVGQAQNLQWVSHVIPYFLECTLPSSREHDTQRKLLDYICGFPSES